jgi:uncharacterized protein (TIGR00369 family)
MCSNSVAIRREKMTALLGRSPLGRHFGMTLSFDGERAVVDLPYNPLLDHGLGATHGGVIAMLIDNAGWFTLAPNYDTWIATVEFQVRLLEPAVHEHLRAVGRTIRVGRRLAVADVEVRTSEGRLVASGSGTYATTDIELELDRAHAPVSEPNP